MKKNTCLVLMVIALVLGIMIVGCAAEDGYGGDSGYGDSSNGGQNGTTNGGNTGGQNEAIKYTVSFNTMGAVGTPPEALIVTTGSTIIIYDDSGFSREGYILDGWYTIISGTTSYYDAGSQYTVTNNVIFYANWAIARTVNFNINDGTGGTPSSQTIINGTSITLPTESDLSRTGYIFNGWNTNSSGSGTNYAAGSDFIVNSNVTLYARWDADIVGTWSRSGGGSYVIGYWSCVWVFRNDLTFSRTFTGDPNAMAANQSFSGTYTVEGSTITISNSGGSPYLFYAAPNSLYWGSTASASLRLGRQ